MVEILVGEDDRKASKKPPASPTHRKIHRPVALPELLGAWG